MFNSLKKIPSSDEGRREWTRRQRLQRRTAKLGVLGLCLLAAAVLAYAVTRLT